MLPSTKDVCQCTPTAKLALGGRRFEMAACAVGTMKRQQPGSSFGFLPTCRTPYRAPSLHLRSEFNPREAIQSPHLDMWLVVIHAPSSVGTTNKYLDSTGECQARDCGSSTAVQVRAQRRMQLVVSSGEVVGSTAVVCKGLKACKLTWTHRVHRTIKSLSMKRRSSSWRGLSAPPLFQLFQRWQFCPF